ncbi:MAG: TolC family protein [Bacteroidales bacterium]|nr:TolC family protein [Bacteroidales bacterium]
MKSTFRYIILSFFLFFPGIDFILNAQDSIPVIKSEASTDIANLTPEYYSKLTLPPLSIFLEAAVNCAKIGALKASRSEQEGGLLTAKREWMNSLRFFGNYQYGALGANVTSASESAGQTILYSGQVQSIYNGGVSIALPFDILYDRKNRINKQRSKLRQADYEIQEALEGLKIEISETYISAIQHLNTLKIQSESVVLATSDVKMSQVNYLNGNTELAELNYRKTIQTTAVANYENTKAQLNMAILHLEILTNIKIIK